MAKKERSYLETVKFDKTLLSTWWARYIVQIRLVLMLILAIVLVGSFAYFDIPRRLNPEIKIPIIMVNATLPGASPQDIEQLITVPIEDALDGVENIDTMVSSSVAGSSTITIQFRSGVDADKAKDTVQSSVDTVNDLPQDATTPRVAKLDFENEPVWTFAITSKSDTASLMRFAKLLKDRLEDNPKIDRVSTSGLDEQQVEVKLLPQQISEYGITPQVLSSAIRRASGSFPAGTVETQESSFAISIDRDVTTVEDIRNLRVTVEGQSIRLGDVATVSYISKTDQQAAFLASESQAPTPSVQFFAFRAKTANIDEAEHEVRKIVDETIAQYNGEFTLITVMNFADEITKQFSDLTRDFLFTILLVFTLLLVFLGLRQAVISSITVPLTFLSSFAIINALGLTLNFLTMFAFLIALGLLIDDTIVTVAAMTRYYATGRFTPSQTGILVWRDFIVPLWSTTITTIWAFVPLLLASGIIGEFIKSIPIVVTATMLSSTTIAVLITLPLMIIFLKPVFPRRVRILFGVLGFFIILASVALFLPKNPLTPLIIFLFALFLFLTYRLRTALFSKYTRFVRKRRFLMNIPSFLGRISNKGILDIEVISRRYMVIIENILVSKHGKRNTLFAIGVFAIVAYLLVPIGYVKNEFFPKQDGNVLYISVELAPGTNLSTTKQEMLSVLDAVRRTKEVTYIVGETGQGFSSGMGRVGATSAFLLTLHLSDRETRDIDSAAIAKTLRERFKTYAKGKFTVQEQSGGPPAGADVQITILGDDLAELDGYANQVIRFLEKEPGVTNIDKSIKPGTSKLVFVPDKEKLAEHNLTSDQVAVWLRTYASGFTLDSVTFGTQEEDVVFRISSEVQTPEDLGQIAIPIGPSGQNAGQEQTLTAVPLLSLGKIQLATNPTTITREKGKRTISVTASVVAGYNVSEINQKLTRFADHGLGLSEGYSWETGGANEENQKSIQSILQAMLISFLLILITMVIEFHSFRQTFIALCIIPLSVAGVLYIFALTATPLSFPALIGILALFGIVVTHAIVVIEKINDNRAHGMVLRHAIVDAAGSRLEPVLLTSAATILGLTPITISDPLWRGLGGAIIAGLLFSGAIKLFFVPVTYYLMFGEDGRKRVIRSRARRSR